MNVNGAFTYMIGIFVLTVLAFTWFFPTLNGSTALNNSTKLELGGTNYSWVVPLIVIVIVLSLVMYYWKSGQI